MSKTMSSMVLGLIFSIMFGCSPYDSPHLNDDRLIHHFLENEREFQRLAADLRADCNKGLTRVAIDRTDPKDPKQIGITDNKIRRYREKLKSLGIKEGYSSNAECKAIELITSIQGWAVSGSAKGYYYSEKLPYNIVNSLDHYKFSRHYADSAYKKIKENWYLFYME